MTDEAKVVEVATVTMRWSDETCDAFEVLRPEGWVERNADGTVTVELKGRYRPVGG